MPACSGPSGGEGATGRAASAIENGSPATAYPEAVVVMAGALLPCSGVLLAPRVVLTAGHCRSSTKSYAVSAPNAPAQGATGSDDWTTYTGDPASSSDTLLIFLDSSIDLPSYPSIAAGQVAAGTQVVDIGRTLNDVITDLLYVSAPVTVHGTGAALGFPFNYQALPDVSQGGDSGGPIELAGAGSHTLVAIVDTDTLEQGVPEGTPIDLFARLDVVRDAILLQVASHPDGAATGPDASTAKDGGARRDGGTKDGGRDARDAALVEASRDDAGAQAAKGGGSSCAMTPVSGVSGGGGASPWVVLVAAAVVSRRRRLA